jgi:hypothetical protein
MEARIHRGGTQSQAEAVEGHLVCTSEARKIGEEATASLALALTAWGILPLK